MVDRDGDRAGLPTDLRRETGPFDVIGDVHGCRLELEALLGALGYAISRDDADRPIGARHPSGRTVVLLGDLADRGPDTPGVFRLVMGMAAAGSGFSVLGNHDDKLLRALSGKKVRVTESLERALAQLHREPAEFHRAVVAFIGGMRAHHLLDGGRLVVAHAGLPESLHGAESKPARRFCLRGGAGDVDELGAPITPKWVVQYRGAAAVLFGHTPVTAPRWVNNTMCLDTGCVFGGSLTALRYPERELVAVRAARVYQEPRRPLRSSPGDAET